MRSIERELLTEAVAKQGHCTVSVGGYCMTPALRNGASVVVESAGPKTLNVGDLAAYFLGDHLYVHRLVAIEDGTLVFKADGPTPPPHRVAVGSVLGRVKAIKNPSIVKRILTKVVTWKNRRAPGAMVGPSLITSR